MVTIKCSEVLQLDGNILMKFFLPDWEDRIDPGYSLNNDMYSDSHMSNPYANDVYAHQIYKENPPYDGILVSLSNYRSKLKLKEDNTGRLSIRGFNDIRDYLKIPISSKLEVMGDSGAFSYVTERNPPQPFFSIENVAGIYNDLNFKFGVSVDHIAAESYLIADKNGKRKRVKRPMSEKRYRVNLTLKNDMLFYHYHRRERLNFIPVGVAQGFDENSYRKSVQKIIEMGYDHIALGGLVQYTDAFIIKILEEIKPLVRGVDVHLFGVLRPDKLLTFRELGVTSFDSASYLRKSWLRSGQNYLTKNNTWYTALRVPYRNNPNVLARAKELGIAEQELETMELEALEAIHVYANGHSSVEKTLEKVLKYDKILLRNSKDERNLEEKYRITLSSRPWDKCDCSICSNLGVDVVIFRGTHRNKQRGFHNNWVFRNQIMPSKLGIIPSGTMVSNT